VNDLPIGPPLGMYPDQAWRAYRPDEYITATPGRDVTLEAIQVAARKLITDEHLHHADIRVWADPALHALVIEMRKHLYRERIGVEPHRFPVTVAAPWSCHVTVPLPQPWWRRLLRRPTRYVHAPASGTVKAHTEVEVSLAHYATYPDFPHRPHEWGAPIRMTEWDAPIFGHTRARRTETRVESGGAAEASREWKPW
jgi:hypothetical protein